MTSLLQIKPFLGLPLVITGLGEQVWQNARCAARTLGGRGHSNLRCHRRRTNSNRGRITVLLGPTRTSKELLCLAERV